MQRQSNFILLFVFLLFSCKQERYLFNLPKISGNKLKFAPELYNEKPELPSPAITDNSREVVLLRTKNNQFLWIDATVENGEPFDYKRQLFGKGNQFAPDGVDFPYFARNAIHTEKELRNTKMITGRSVSQITVDGRPRGSSGVGFMAEDETIMSVIYADNLTVKKLGLTHADIARPLFHFWNISREFKKYKVDSIINQRIDMETLIYNGYNIKSKTEGSRGWQESVFDDEILGTGHIEIWRDLTNKEKDFLKIHYSQLSMEQFEQLKKMVSWFHTCEMVFFYINRYGFYEGHTEYRPDPLTIVLVFGLKSIEEVHLACGGDLYHYFNEHFTQNPE